MFRCLGLFFSARQRRTLGTNSETPEYVNEYLQGYRSPSRAYPKSYFQALRTVKFAKFLTAHDPEMAVEIGVAKREEVK